MSNRTLMEFNHDHAYSVERDPEGFVRAVSLYLSSGSRREAEALERYGVTVIRMRHHSDDFMVGLPPESKG